MENKNDETLNKIFKNIEKKTKLSVGDIVYGTVEDINKNLVIVNIESLNGKVLAASNRAVLLVKDMDKGYTENIEDNYNPGDIVRAKIIFADKFGFKLTTAEDDLGVIIAKCTNCNNKFKIKEYNNKQIKCPKCGKLQTRKFAKGVKNGY